MFKIFVNSWKTKEIRNKILYTLMIFAIIRIGTQIALPVSYTHLDVYKRQGGQLVRSAGNVAQLMAKEGKYATVKLPSGEMRLLPIECRATTVSYTHLKSTGRSKRRRF